jgi:hypothetical protein
MIDNGHHHQQQILNKRGRSLSSTLNSSPHSFPKKVIIASSSSMNQDEDSVIERLSSIQQYEQSVKPEEPDQELDQSEQSESSEMQMLLNEPRDRLYLKFVNTLADFIHTHDLQGLMEILYQPYFEPDLRLLTKYWNRSATAISVQNSAKPVATATSSAGTGTGTAADCQQPPESGPSRQRHPFSGRNILKNGRYHALKLFALHFHLIPDGMFQIDDIRIIPTIYGNKKDQQQEHPIERSRGDGLRIVSSFRYSGTLVSGLPLPSCEDVHDNEDIQAFLHKIQTSSTTPTIPSTTPSNPSLSETTVAGLHAMPMPHQYVLEPRYASFENRHFKDEILKNVLGNDSQVNAEVMRRLGGIFDAEHWLKSQQSSSIGNLEQHPRDNKQLRFVSREEMLATLSMMRPISTSSVQTDTSDPIAKGHTTHSSSSMVRPPSPTSDLVTAAAQDNSIKKRKKSAKATSGEAPLPTVVAHTSHPVVPQDNVTPDGYPPIGLLEEFNALFQQQQQQQAQDQASTSTSSSSLSHAIQMFINVSGYFIIHFNASDKVDRIEFHYYDVV